VVVVYYTSLRKRKNVLSVFEKQEKVCSGIEINKKLKPIVMSKILFIEKSKLDKYIYCIIKIYTKKYKLKFICV